MPGGRFGRMPKPVRRIMQCRRRMNTVEQIIEPVRFPSGMPWTIAVLTIRLDESAARFNMEPASWDDDGLGPTRGLLIRLPSGRIVLIQEQEYAIKHQGIPGFELVVDGGDMVSLGVDALLDEVLHAFGLSESAVYWKADEDSRQSAAQILAAWRGRS